MEVDSTKNTISIHSFKSMLNKSTSKLNIEDIINEIITYLKNNIDNDKINSLYKKIKFFNKDKIGRSGALIGMIKINGKEYIIKIFKLDKSLKYNYKYDNKTKCIKIYYPFNELIVNTIFANMKTFLSNIDYIKYKSRYNKFIIPLKDIGLSDKYSYMINAKIGINYKTHYLTNLKDIIIISYIPNILDCIKDNDTKTIDIFFKKFTNILKKYFKCIQFLNEKLNYINTDMKCDNVFIKKNNNKSLKNFITNYTPLISDLDKATLKINNVLILPVEDYMFERILKTNKGIGSKIFEMRYNCNRNTLLCNRFKPYLYDIIMLIIYIYIILYKYLYIKLNIKIKDYYKFLNIFNDFFKKTLNITDKELVIFLNTIHKSKISKLIKDADIKYWFLYKHYILYKFCKNIK